MSTEGPQPTQRLVVVDLEATCWESDEHPALAANQSNETEIIEIGAVNEAGETFRVVIRPRRHPVLSAFCTELTGLTQAEVEAGVPFPEAVAAFRAWAGADEGLVVASWGAYDQRLLLRDSLRHGLPKPRWTHRNIKRLFAARAKREGAPRGGWMGLSAALAWAGLEFEGTPHRAVDDAVNAGRVLRWAETEGS